MSNINILMIIVKLVLTPSLNRTNEIIIGKISIF